MLKEVTMLSIFKTFIETMFFIDVTYLTKTFEFFFNSKP